MLFEEVFFDSSPLLSIINQHYPKAKPIRPKMRSIFLKSASTADFIRHLH